jgi:hypothetical protein
LVINFYAGTYANIKAGNPVGDIILDNLPVLDLDWAFIYGPVLMWILAACIALPKPKVLPFILMNISLFVVIRSGFVILTHLGTLPDQINIDYTTSFIRDFTFGGDMFFSGHTGLPFLMALIYFNKKLLRYFFIACSIFFGFVVLATHTHYSIDVASAFFITYTIHHLAHYLFPKEAEVFESQT